MSPTATSYTVTFLRFPSRDVLSENIAKFG